MPTRQQAATQTISPVLFLTVDGEPMSFFLRPGPIKRQLQPKIRAGGGVMCSTQQPGAILLIDPEDKSSVSAADAHLYVSTQYILDCIEKEEQLDVEDYRLTPDNVPKRPAKKDRTKRGCGRQSGGKMADTSDYDASILKYVSTRKTKTCEIPLSREMEKDHLTCQAMKDRCTEQLAEKLPQVVKGKSTEKEEGSEAEEDETEVCGTTLMNADTHESSSSKDKSENQQTDGTETRKAQASNCSSAENPSAKLQADIQPGSAEAADPDRDGPQTADVPRNQSLPEDGSPVHSESPAKVATPGKQKDKQASPVMDQPTWRITRRRLELEAAASPELYGKKLRSSSSSIAFSPQSPKKTKPVKAALQKGTETEHPPPKRARGNVSTAVEQTPPEQREPEAQQKTDKSKSPLKEKRKRKRQLGILELATKEFEDGSESDEEDDLGVQDATETVATSAERLPPPTDTAADPSPETTSSPNENVPETAASSDNCVPDTCSPVLAATKPAVSEPVGVTSKAHLFIFDRESQEDDSQRVAGDSSAAPSNPQHSASKDASLSFTQVQLEEDKQQIKELMVQTQQDLISVTKALLKTSGNFSAALDLLLNPSSFSASIWSRYDDSLLFSADPVIRQQLQEKYGEESVAKRMVFLEVEG